MNRLRRAPATLANDDDGSTLPLVLVFGLVGLLLVLGVASVTSLYLERKRLFTLADGAALAAAEAWSIDTVRVDGETLAFELTDAEVARAGADYLAEASTSIRDVEVVRASSPDGATALVTLRAVWVAPISTDLLPLTLPIEVTATARSVFH